MSICGLVRLGTQNSTAQSPVNFLYLSLFAHYTLKYLLKFKPNKSAAPRSDPYFDREYLTARSNCILIAYLTINGSDLLTTD